MKITILIGWPARTTNGSPSGRPSVLSVVDSDGPDRREQFGVLDSAKRLHQYPKGTRALALAIDENPTLAAFVSEEAAALIKGHADQQAKIEAAMAAKAAAAEKRRSDLAKAAKDLSTAAVKWNQARQNVIAAERTLKDDETNYRFAQSDAFKAKVEASRERLAKAQKAEQSAHADYDTAKKAKADLENPPKPDTKPKK